jgi:FHA domain-containing protein
MTTEIILFVLRLVSGLLLSALLTALFIVMWRDYRSAAREVEATRRSYGRLVEIQEVDDVHTPTGKSYPLLPLTSLGRAPTNTISINDNFASGEHALVAMRSGRWWLEDRHSRNGTTLNGVTITQPVIVTDNDVIGIGHMHFRIEMEQ